jgi:hypothetical protein
MFIYRRTASGVIAGLATSSLLLFVHFTALAFADLPLHR